MKLSIVIPVYNEEENIQPLYDELISVLRGKYKYESIFVDDGSTDKTLSILTEIHKKDKNLKIVQHRKNFGKSAALMSGFSLASGDIILTLDGDLQDDPLDIPAFIAKINEGYDLVNGWRSVRMDTIRKKIASSIFNKFTACLTKTKMHDLNCGFKAYRKDLVKDIYLYGDLYRYIPAIAHFNGYKVTEIKANNRPRRYGETKYNYSRLSRGFFDLFTISFLAVFKKRPLHFFGPLGASILALGFFFATYLTREIVISRKFIVRPLLFAAIILIVVGVQIISLGLLAEMVVSWSKEDAKKYARRVIR